MKKINNKELDQAMEEMECWSVNNHLKKCKKHIPLKEIKQGLKILAKLTNVMIGGSYNITNVGLEQYVKVNDVIKMLNRLNKK